MDNAIKSIIDRMWNSFWEGGVTNPLTVIEQITYLLFIKGLDDIEIAHEKNDVMLGITTKKILIKIIKIADGVYLKTILLKRCLKLCKKTFFLSLRG